VTQGYGTPTRVNSSADALFGHRSGTAGPTWSAAAVRKIRIYRWRTARPSSGTMRAYGGWLRCA